LTGQHLAPCFEPPRTGDVRSSQADLSAAEKDLGYQPLVDWQQGLARTLEFYRAQPR
jgi:UDP-glucose 4-epimerase